MAMQAIVEDYNYCIQNEILYFSGLFPKTMHESKILTFKWVGGFPNRPGIPTDVQAKKGNK